MIKALTLALSLLLLSGCSTAMTKAWYGDGPAFDDFHVCSQRTSVATMGDVILTGLARTQMSKCMNERGWVRVPNSPDGPAAYVRAK